MYSIEQKYICCLLANVMAEGLTLLSCFLEVLGLDLGSDIERSD